MPRLALYSGVVVLWCCGVTSMLVVFMQVLLYWLDVVLAVCNVSWEAMKPVVAMMLISFQLLI